MMKTEIVLNRQRCDCWQFSNYQVSVCCQKIVRFVMYATIFLLQLCIIICHTRPIQTFINTDMSIVLSCIVCLILFVLSVCVGISSKLLYVNTIALSRWASFTPRCELVEWESILTVKHHSHNEITRGKKSNPSSRNISWMRIIGIIINIIIIVIIVIIILEL